jgi:hypothetical protein
MSYTCKYILNIVKYFFELITESLYMNVFMKEPLNSVQVYRK